MRLIILNGATRGLGLAIAQHLVVNNEPNIYCLVRDLSCLSELEFQKDHLHLFKCDYSNLQDLKKIGNQLFDKIDFSKFDDIYFINNLAVIAPIDTINNLDINLIIESININITSNLIVIKEFLNHITDFNGSAYILNISAGISKSAVPGLIMYGLAKVYLDYLTISLNKEKNIYPFQLCSTSFYPGGIDTQMQKKLHEALDKKSLSSFDYTKILMQKLEKPEIIANFIYNYFIKERNGWNEEINSFKNIINHG